MQEQLEAGDIGNAATGAAAPEALQDAQPPSLEVLLDWFASGPPWPREFERWLAPATTSSEPIFPRIARSLRFEFKKLVAQLEEARVQRDWSREYTHRDGGHGRPRPIAAIVRERDEAEREIEQLRLVEARHRQTIAELRSQLHCRQGVVEELRDEVAVLRRELRDRKRYGWDPRPASGEGFPVGSTNDPTDGGGRVSACELLAAGAFSRFTASE